jgi:8-oxo-dGTP pyrophosphatase MutT (NUDIX family)
MFLSLPQARQDELEQLAQRYGQPLVRLVDLNIDYLFDPLNRKDDRLGEVCMVVRRPNGHLLIMKKTFYPRDGYRLMTGGVNQKEPILDALLRETHEETGLQVTVNRFLAAVAYRVLAISDTSIFYTFAFLLDEIGGTLGSLDDEERVEAFREIEPSELNMVAAKLDAVPSQNDSEIDGNWRDWGEFRAIIHRLVWEALS